MNKNITHKFDLNFSTTSWTICSPTTSASSQTRTSSWATRTKPGTVTDVHRRSLTSHRLRVLRGWKTSTTADRRGASRCRKCCRRWRVATTRSLETRTPCSRTRFTAWPSSSSQPSSSSWSSSWLQL